ncbi:MAG: AAA family ATPase [Magnetococcales bacterium]|nr:AAA family ATPase [Magnetococcales bacterium]
MYLGHFGLQEQPFQLIPDTGFFHFSPSVQESFNVALVALSFGEGFVKITGEAGTGKTMLMKKLQANFQDRDQVTACFLNPLLTPEDAYKALADELAVPPDDGSMGFQHRIRQLTDRLVELRQQGKKVVLFVDEAQSLTDETLEAIRLMTNLDTERQKTLQVVLLGQPELDHRLERQYNLRQLRQRITFSCHLLPLDARETGLYLNHRLQIAGFQGDDVFTAPAVRRIHRLSGGIPRLINVLAHKCLLIAVGRGERIVDVAQVATAALDTEGLAVSSWKNYWRRIGSRWGTAASESVSLMERLRGKRAGGGVS